jgi:tyrosyl-tRNA synthetase
MSKSLGNTIGLTDAPDEMYGRVMSIPDALLPAWVRLLGLGRWPELVAQVAALEAGGGDPLSSKQALAAKVVERFHGPKAALDAAEHFRRVVQLRELPQEIPLVQLAVAAGSAVGLLDAMRTALGVHSNAEARRLIAQGAVELDGVRVSDPTVRLMSGTHLIRAGRRRVVRVEIGEP